MHNPAIANPRGTRNAPIAEKISPNNQIIQSKTGIQHKKSPINARTNPAVPIPFDFFCSLSRPLMLAITGGRVSHHERSHYE